MIIGTYLSKQRRNFTMDFGQLSSVSVKYFWIDISLTIFSSIWYFLPLTIPIESECNFLLVTFTTTVWILLSDVLILVLHILPVYKAKETENFTLRWSDAIITINKPCKVCTTMHGCIYPADINACLISFLLW